MVLTRRIATLAAAGIGCAALWIGSSRTAGADVSLTARVGSTAASPIAIQCSAVGEPSETGTPNYYLLLRASYQNPGRRPIVPVVIKFTFYGGPSGQGAVVASRTVIDSTGLQPGYGNSGQWQSIGFPQTARSMTCLGSAGKSS